MKLIQRNFPSFNIIVLNAMFFPDLMSNLFPLEYPVYSYNAHLNPLIKKGKICSVSTVLAKSLNSMKTVKECTELCIMSIICLCEPALQSNLYHSHWTVVTLNLLLRYPFKGSTINHLGGVVQIEKKIVQSIPKNFRTLSRREAEGQKVRKYI